MNCPSCGFLGMVRLLVLLIALTAFILSAEGGTVTGRVVKVHDGDTITVLDGNYTQHKIRLDGIDAPERGQDFGAKATQALKAVLGSGQVVVEVTTKDKYGRSIGQVMVGQNNVNAWMVERVGVALQALFLGWLACGIRTNGQSSQGRLVGRPQTANGPVGLSGGTKNQE